MAQISISCKRTHLGYFNTEYEAACRYDKKASELNRPMNFPANKQSGAEQAKKTESAVIVGPNAGFTKGPYRKRVPVDSSLNEVEMSRGIVDGVKQRKKKAIEVQPSETEETSGHTPFFNPEMIMQMFIQQQSLLRASEDQGLPENHTHRDSNVAGMLMELAHRDSGYDFAGESRGQEISSRADYRAIVRM